MENLVLLLWLCADPVVPAPDANTPSVIAPTPQPPQAPQGIRIPLTQPKYFDNKSDYCVVCTRSEWFRNNGRRDD
jgi:hypothetical protein